ncbi:response regulator transcription factor [Amycolatopsis sp. cmx-4-61]|uniref:helix-turn-helix transcriptional regulator n=1 Tax=Amycolatopsis sp. cmx-4-61 TaxID=2790937 RepID=UPI00397B97CE
MNVPIPVLVHASDPVTRFGITAQLSRSNHLTLVLNDQVDGESVTILAVDAVDDETMEHARRYAACGCHRFILVTPREPDEEQLRATLELGLGGILDRRTATPERLEQVILKTAQGESELPSDLLVRVFRHPQKASSHSLALRLGRSIGLTPRESQVLRLVADGLDTEEIAVELSYSSRTVKNIVHAVTTRYCLRNRSHAVAYALREGLI